MIITTILATWVSLAPQAASAPQAAAARPKLVVLEITPAGGISAEVAGAITEAITGEISRRDIYEVVSAKEVQTLVGMERQKALIGCSNEASTCLAELAGALGARFVFSGTLAKLGEAYQLTVQTLDSARAQPIGRATRLAKDLTALRADLPYAVAEAAAIPLPPPPSRVLPYSLVGGGALVGIAAGVAGFFGLSNEAALNAELEAGSQRAGLLTTAASYQERANVIGLEKTLSLVGLGVAAALVAGGIYLNPSEGRGAVALVPTTTGVAFVGAFP